MEDVEGFEAVLAKMLALNPRDVRLTLTFATGYSKFARAHVRGDDGYSTVFKIDPEHIGLYKQALERRRIEVRVELGDALKRRLKPQVLAAPMTSNTKPGAQHGARDDILGRIRRALSIPSRYGHGLSTHAAASPQAIAPDSSNPLGSNAAPLAPDKPTQLEGESIGIRPAPLRADDALETAGWVPGGQAAQPAKPAPMSIPLNVISNSGVGTNESSWRAWLPPVGHDYEARIALLERNLLDLKAEFVRVPDHGALQVLAAQMARENNWRRIARHASPLLDSALQGLGSELTELPELKVLSVDASAQGFDALELEGCEVGWSTCDALIAQTGTVLLSALGSGGRALSVLPPHHVVVATREQLVPDLPAAFETLSRLYQGGLPSSLSFITGPSRTGDIERILVLGAHGPKRLTVILLG